MTLDWRFVLPWSKKLVDSLTNAFCLTIDKPARLPFLRDIKLASHNLTGLCIGIDAWSAETQPPWCILHTVNLETCFYTIPRNGPSSLILGALNHILRCVKVHLNNDDQHQRTGSATSNGFRPASRILFHSTVTASASAWGTSPTSSSCSATVASTYSSTYSSSNRFSCRCSTWRTIPVCSYVFLSYAFEHLKSHTYVQKRVCNVCARFPCSRDKIWRVWYYYSSGEQLDRNLIDIYLLFLLCRIP